MRAVAQEWAQRQPPPENCPLLEPRLPMPREQGLLERCSEFQARIRQSYRPMRSVHKRSEKSGAVPIRGSQRSNVLRDVPYLTFFSVT
jgi:hypothetical protein